MTPAGDNQPSLWKDGKADARQGGPDQKTSRFRTRYRQLNAEEINLHDAIKEHAEEMENLFNRVKSGRYRSLAFTALEESVMWVIKELTSDPGVPT